MQKRQAGVLIKKCEKSPNDLPRSYFVGIFSLLRGTNSVKTHNLQSYVFGFLYPKGKVCVWASGRSFS